MKELQPRILGILMDIGYSDVERGRNRVGDRNKGNKLGIEESRK